MSDKATILAVDDTSESLALLVGMLTPAGYRVHAADSGELALAAVAVSPPDLILLDVRMKGIDGLEVCRRLKASEETRHIPVILISAFADVKEWVAGLQMGAADYITKPFQVEELLTRVGTHLALRLANVSIERQSVALLEANERLRSEISGRKHVEDQLRRSLSLAERSRNAILSALEDQKMGAEALRQSEERFQVLFDTAADTILLLEVTPEGVPVIRAANRSALTALGYQPQELLGQPVSFIEAGADASRLADERRRGILSGAENLFEVQHRCKDGTIRDLECSVTEMRIGSKVFAISVERDITDRNRAEKERERLEEQLRTSQKMEAIGSLAGGIAHDFNNLLYVILSYTGFALEAVREGDPQWADLSEVKKAGDRAAVLVRQLLAFSRKQILEPKALDLNQVALDLEKMLRRILGEDIDFVQALAPDLGLAFADPGQIEQVLMNLVVNARDAMPEGGKLTIETSNVELNDEHRASHMSVAPGRYVMLAVTDTGCGMDAETQSRIFEPFFTTKEQGKGTGLGLPTVYGIVRQSGGDIHVYSKPSQGTTFKIYLPRKNAQRITDSRLSAAPTRLKGDETIMVVEDEEAVRNLTKRILGAAGYTVLLAASGGEALAKCERQPEKIHLVLTDVVMPEMGGREFAERLEKVRPGTKVLYMSGYTDDAIVHHGALDPGTKFIGKPFNATDLARKVREVLDERV